jgi:tetratricopeptide (TPR) repeat protein
LYAIDPDRRLDPQAFAPKVIELAEEAKAEEGELRCRSVLTQLDERLANSESSDTVSFIESNQKTCPTLSSIRPKVADNLFKEGLDAYKKDRLQEALEKFQLALRMDSKHELSSQYVDLTKSKLEVAADRALLAWRKDFNAGDFASAVRDYRELASHSRADKIDEVRGEYRRILAGLVESWNAACAKNDTVGMEAVRVRVNTMLPESSFAEDLIAKMNNCTPTGCLQMTAPMALARLKNRVDPVFPPYVIAQMRTSPVTVRVKTRINEKGDVTGSEPQAGNPLLYPAVRAAVEQWKFSPAVVQGDARCVDTEIPITINFTTGK